MADKVFIGADIAQDWIDIAVAGQPQRKLRIDNTEKAISDWVASLRKSTVAKVALIAVMRKMLVTLNAMARDGQPWEHAAVQPA